MTARAKQNTTETLPRSLNQVRAIAARIFEDLAATDCYIQTIFGEVRVVRPSTPGEQPEVYMASQEYRDFCKFLNSR